MRIAFAGLLAGILVGSAAAAEPFGLKGVVIGEKVDLQKLYDNLGYVAHDSVLDGRRCQGLQCGDGRTGQLVGEPAEILLAIDDSRIQVIAAIFESKDFQKVLSAFSQKYGKPPESGKQMKQNLMGATFVDVSAFWRDSAGNTMGLASHWDARHGALIIQSKSEVARDKAIHEKAKSDI